ncbi:MAG: hypothetical protein NTX22_09175 [Ignavibacteriales bacterium]|nr:hypothetical protein [Ignavibacteriales bacterium]
MTLQAILLVVHILSAVIWLSLLPADLILRQFISASKGKSGERKLLSVYLKLTNTTGIIGMTGILITGIILISVLPYYSFFQFSVNHWLATKQVIMVILIILTFAVLIPKAKKVRTELSDDFESSVELLPSFYEKLRGLWKIVTVINILVLINFLLAITHRFF